MRINKSNITAAFKELEIMGYFCAQNFLCCHTCGINAVPDEFENKYLFYNAQDNDRLKEHGTTFLAWQGNGEEICQILQKHNLSPQWDGNKKTKISIQIPNFVSKPIKQKTVEEKIKQTYLTMVKSAMKHQTKAKSKGKNGQFSET